jgi:pilus assembly protein Flp/PilA
MRTGSEEPDPRRLEEIPDLVNPPAPGGIPLPDAALDIPPTFNVQARNPIPRSSNMFQMLKNRRGAAVVEYSLLVAGVALISAAAISVFGHKTSDLIAATATVLPGAHADDNGPIVSGKLIETTGADTGAIAIDVQGIAAGTDSGRLGNNLLGLDPNGDGFGGLVLEAGDVGGGGN